MDCLDVFQNNKRKIYGTSKLQKIEIGIIKQPFPMCEICGKITKNERGMEIHTKAIHEKIKEKK